MAVAAAEQLQTNTYIEADLIAEVYEARGKVRGDAYVTLEQRKQQILTGEWQYVPPAIDALSTAHRVLDARLTYGETSPEVLELDAGLQLDCLRLVAEWFRKNKPEYFPAVEHTYIAETDDFYSHGLSIRQLTENALTPQSGDIEEEQRRVNERVEESTPQLLRKFGALALEGAGVRTISECTDGAIAAYKHDMKIGAPHRGYNGYVPEIEKLMIRDIRLDETTNNRYEEQVGLPGIYITHEIIQLALARRGIDAAHKDKTELHATQMVVYDNLFDFVALLDQVASEQWCTTVFMGEKVNENHPRDYAAFHRDALSRQASLEAQAGVVKLFVLDLAEQGVNHRDAPQLVEDFVKKLLLSMARTNIKLAPQIFDAKTATGLNHVAYLESIGLYQEAATAFEEVAAAAPGGGYCGAGTCDLVAIASGSADEVAVKKLGFGDSKDVIKDTVRKCPCGAKKVYYDLKQGKKGCTACGKTAKY
jgi:hypothetical protein